MSISTEETAERKRVKARKPCDRCGRIRTINKGRGRVDGGICQDCRLSDPQWPTALRCEVSA